MDKYLVTKEAIEAHEGLDKALYLNPKGRRINKSLGDMTGLRAIGFHIIDVPVGCESTEKHVHYVEEECVYVLEGEGEAEIGEQTLPIKSGDHIGYRAGGEPHLLRNTSAAPLRCIVVGQRLDTDVADYTNLRKRLFRLAGRAWNLVGMAHIVEPVAGQKV